MRPGQTRSGPEGEDFFPTPATFEQLHDAKINLDGIIDDLQEGRKGNEQVGAPIPRRSPQQVGADPAPRSPQIQRGADLYIDLTGPIDRMKNGLLGALQALRPTDAASAMNLGRLFDAFKVSDASLVREVRQAFQEAGKLEIFNKGFRAYMQEVIGRALKSAADADPASLSNRLVKELFKTPKQRAVFQEAVGDPKAYSDFVRFFDIIRRVSKTKAEGSPTATDIGGIEELTGPAAKAATTVTQPLRLPQRLGDWITKASIQRRSDQLAKLYTTEAGGSAPRNSGHKTDGTCGRSGPQPVLVTAIGEGFL